MEAPVLLSAGPRHRLSVAGLAMLLVALPGCATQGARPTDPTADGDGRDADSLLVVDCLLPGQLRRLGQIMAFVTPQRPIRTTASICEIRGGEYVAYDRANFATALKTWLPKAQEGDPEAQTYVGEIYEKGLGLEPDLEVALDWYEKAAEQGHSRAQINLGFLYESGVGVERDLARAMNYYRAASGFTEAKLEYVTAVEIANREAEKRQIVDLQAQVTKLEADNAELEREQARLSASEREVAALRAEIDAQRGRVIELAAAERESAPSDAEARLAEALADIADVNARLETSESEQRRLLGRLAEQQSRTSEIRKRYAAVDAELAAARDAVRERERRIDRLRGELSEIDAARATAGEASAAPRRAELESELARERALAADLAAELERLKSAQSAESRELEERLAQAEASEAALSERLDESNGRIGALQARLRDQEQVYRGQLEELREEVELLSAGRAELEGELARSGEEQKRLRDRLADAQLDARRGGTSAARELARLEQQLEEKERLIADQQSDIGRLQTEVAQTRARLDQPEIEQVLQVVSSGPSIEIIEPPTLLMRGSLTLAAPAGSAGMSVIGRVDPVDSLLSLQINGVEGEVNENGVFRHRMNVESDTTLRVVAVDRAGERTETEFALLAGGEAPTPAPSPAPAPSSPREAVPGALGPEVFGNYHALIIGNNEYEHLRDLRTAENDAIAVEKLLRTKYGFETELLLNATRYDLLSALNRKRDELTERDNLLIYYAGHGELSNAKGFWMPVDAEPDNTSNWIANSSITDLVESMRAKHVMIMADSCYSGSLTRSSLTRLGNEMTGEQRLDWYRAVSALKVRTVFTSGGVRPVLDSTSYSKHSLFAAALLDELERGSGVVQAYDLFLEVQARVREEARKLSLDQNPQYSPIRFAGHESGEFLFVADDVAGRSAGRSTGADPERRRLRVASTRRGSAS